MYYECHITSRSSEVSKIEPLAKKHRFKTSEIARDPVMGDDVFFYCTSHGKDYADLYYRMRKLSDEMKQQEIPVLRLKIEHVVFDTKTGVK